MTLQRYEWEDALIAAELDGYLPAGAVNMALRLAKAITWKRGGTPELRWKNQTACESVGVARATYFRHRKSLFETGFLTEVRGNLVPQLPDLSQIETVQSQNDTVESQNDTVEFQTETPESQSDNPYTVDTYTGDSFTVDEYTVETAPVLADAPTVPVSAFDESKEDSVSSLVGNTGSVLEVGDIPESQIETVDDWADWTPPVRETVTAGTTSADDW